MNFLGVGPAELIVILVVALVFVGPERLPRLAADVARTIREIRKYTGGLAAEFNEVIQDFEKDTQSERSAWKEIESGITGATQSVTNAVRDARSELQGTSIETPAGSAAAVSGRDGGPAGTTPTWAEIPSDPPEPPRLAVPPANGVDWTNAATPQPATSVPGEEAR